jgi:hypothetical protein
VPYCWVFCDPFVAFSRNYYEDEARKTGVLFCCCCCCAHENDTRQRLDNDSDLKNSRISPEQPLQIEKNIVKLPNFDIVTVLLLL